MKMMKQQQGLGDEIMRYNAFIDHKMKSQILYSPFEAGPCPKTERAKSLHQMMLFPRQASDSHFACRSSCSPAADVSTTET